MPSLLNFLCFAFCIYAVVGQEKPQMMLFQGSVNSTNQCIHTDITNTTVCTISCAKNESCLLTVMKPSQCIHCNYGMVSSLTRGPSDTYISLKVSHGFQYLIQDSPSFSWYFSIDISLLTESVPWPFKSEEIGTCPYGTTGLKICDTGYKMFLRGKIWYCLKVSVNDSTFPQTEGQELCKREGAVLSGLETEDEHRFVNASAHNLMRLHGKLDEPKWGLWISGRKKAECEQELTTEPGPCERMNGFYFEDKTLQQKNGYNWYDGEPNNYMKNQSCIYMMIGGTENQKMGKLDDASCVAPSTFSMRATLCGKEAR